MTSFSNGGDAVERGNETRRIAMAKGQVRKSKEARKPKKAKVKTIAANPQRSPLEHLKNN